MSKQPLDRLHVRSPIFVGLGSAGSCLLDGAISHGAPVNQSAAVDHTESREHYNPSQFEKGIPQYTLPAVVDDNIGKRIEAYSDYLDDGAGLAISLSERIRGASVVVLFTGLGGMTGTAMCIATAKFCEDHNVPLSAIVTLPFRHEGDKRRALALDALQVLVNRAAVIQAIDHTRLLDRLGPGSRLAPYLDEMPRLACEALTLSVYPRRVFAPESI